MKTTLLSLAFVYIILLYGFSLKTIELNEISGIEEGLIVYFPFKGNALDEGKNHYTGTVKRAKLCSDRNGVENNAYCFNGSDNYIQIDNVKELDKIEAITVCAWINPQSYTIENWASWVSKPVRENFSQFRIGFGREPDKLWGLTLYDSTWTEYYANNNIPLNKWSYVVFILDAKTKTAKAYLNGKEVGSLQNVKKIPDSQSPLYIGYQADDRTMFDGMIDEVRIYNRVLKPEEIIILYNLK